MYVRQPPATPVLVHGSCNLPDCAMLPVTHGTFLSSHLPLTPTFPYLTIAALHLPPAPHPQPRSSASSSTCWHSSPPATAL